MNLNPGTVKKMFSILRYSNKSVETRNFWIFCNVTIRVRYYDSNSLRLFLYYITYTLYMYIVC